MSPPPWLQSAGPHRDCHWQAGPLAGGPAGARAARKRSEPLAAFKFDSESGRHRDCREPEYSGPLARPCHGASRSRAVRKTHNLAHRYKQSKNQGLSRWGWSCRLGHRLEHTHDLGHPSPQQPERTISTSCCPGRRLLYNFKIITNTATNAATVQGACKQSPAEEGISVVSLFCSVRSNNLASLARPCG